MNCIIFDYTANKVCVKGGWATNKWINIYILVIINRTKLSSVHLWIIKTYSVHWHDKMSMCLSPFVEIEKKNFQHVRCINLL